MFVAVSFGLAAAAWRLGRLSTVQLGLALGAAAGGGVLGALVVEDPYPWSNLLVLAVSATGGVLLGRRVAARFTPMLVLLVVLSVLDASQLLFAGGTAQRTDLWFHFVIRGAGGGDVLRIGIADLVLVAAFAEHGRRRGLGFWRATPPGPVGLAMSSVYAYAIRPAQGLVLIPFLTAGWLVIEAIGRLARKRRPPITRMATPR